MHNKSSLNAHFIITFGFLLVISTLLIVHNSEPSNTSSKNILPTFPGAEGYGSNTPDSVPTNATLKTILPAFPGAEGYGSYTPGGRFGKIIFVTNLNDTKDVYSPEYPGSLRWAVEHNSPNDFNTPYGYRRIILFKIGGTINLIDKITIRNPFVTIAGQTAPGDGILLRGDQLTIATHDVIVRGIRVRIGDEGSPTCCRDGINISTTEAESDVYNIIIDHCSVSWAIDENVSTYTSDKKPFKIHDITIQWNIVSEALNNSIHLDEGADVTSPHSMGMLIGKNGYNVSIHHNLFANNSGRNPRISGIINSEIINNVIYGWKDKAVEISGDRNVTHVLYNYFILDEYSKDAEVFLSKNMDRESQIFLRGNLTVNFQKGDSVIPARIDNPENFQLSSEVLFEPSGVTISSSEEVFEKVVFTAGATVPYRDEVDWRVINNVIKKTGRIIDSQDEVGGWPVYESGQYPKDSDNDGIPDSWELTHNLSIYSGNDANNPDFLAPSGYTWLEEYINSLFFATGTNSVAN